MTKIIGEEDGSVPVNNVGGGNIASAGIGPEGAVAVGKYAMDKYKNENLNNSNYASTNKKKAPQHHIEHALRMIRGILADKHQVGVIKNEFD